MKTKQLTPPNPLWLKPLLYNEAYVLGYDTDLPVNADIQLAINQRQTGGGEPQPVLFFWRGAEIEARIEEFLATNAIVPDSDVIIWKVCLAWLYQFIHARRHSLQNVIGSLCNDGAYVRYEPHAALVCLGMLHAHSLGCADGFRTGGMVMPIPHSWLDEKVRLNNVMSKVSGAADKWKRECHIECPHCDDVVEIDEIIYIAWRDKELHSVTCPICKQDIVASPLRAAKCESCHQSSGLMPMSMALAIDAGQVPDFKCSECVAILLAKRPATAGKPQGEVSPTNQPQGCVFLLVCMASAATICGTAIFVLSDLRW